MSQLIRHDLELLHRTLLDGKLPRDKDIAKDLAPAIEIVLIGHGTSKSNAAEFQMNYLKTHHPSRDRSTGEGNRDSRPLDVN